MLEHKKTKDILLKTKDSILLKAKDSLLKTEDILFKTKDGCILFYRKVKANDFLIRIKFHLGRATGRGKRGYRENP